jgi:actin-related protein 5
MKRLPSDWSQEIIEGTVLLSGGNTLFDGIDRRLCNELKKTRPQGSIIKVVKAEDPQLDAWHGATLYANSPAFYKCVFTKADYEEKGEYWLQKYMLKYSMLG